MLSRFTALRGLYVLTAADCILLLCLAFFFVSGSRTFDTVVVAAVKTPLSASFLRVVMAVSCIVRFLGVLKCVGEVKSW